MLSVFVRTLDADSDINGTMFEYWRVMVNLTNFHANKGGSTR